MPRTLQLCGAFEHTDVPCPQIKGRMAVKFSRRKRQLTLLTLPKAQARAGELARVIVQEAAIANMLKRGKREGLPAFHGFFNI